MNNETSTIKKTLLNLAKSMNCEIYKNSSNNWIIQSFRYKNCWTLEEQEENRWLLQFNDSPGIILNTEQVIKSFRKINGSLTK